MRKLLTTAIALLAGGSLFAGGLVTNTNQSASWVRLPSRNASAGVDAVFFNPAGLMKLENGFHVSVSNQTIFQTKEVENFYKGPGGKYGLNESLYIGDVKAPLFPSVYGVYKMDRMAFSLGFNPIGGGGGAEYSEGLPSFELAASDLVPSLATAYGAKQYRLDAYLKGSSVFFGLQGGVSFKVNEWLSVAAGMRYVMAKNTYNGHLTDIEINVGTIETPSWTRADGIMTTIAAGATTAATSTTQLVNGGAGSLTLAQAQTAGIIDATQRAQLEGALTAFGSPTTVTISTADAVFKGAAARYNATATLLGDQTVDAAQSGSGITPIFSVNISPTENLNIGIKYEMKTRMEIENKTTEDFLMGFQTNGTPITMFPDGTTTPSDMPAMLTGGVDYKLSDGLKVSAGFNYFFDKSADYGRKLNLDNVSATPSTFVKNKDIIDNNGWSLHGGLEASLSEKLLISGGYIISNKGVNEKYQSDLTYAQASHTFGAGGAYKITDNILLNAGLSYTIYVDDESTIDYVSANRFLYKVNQTYGKSAFIFAVGVDLSF